jgi:hypothetical protein
VAAAVDFGEVAAAAAVDAADTNGRFAKTKKGDGVGSEGLRGALAVS